MKIVLATFEYPPTVGGVATYLKNLYTGLPVEVHIFSPRAAVPYVWWMYPRWYPYYRALKKYVRAVQPDELHISHVLPVGRMAYWLWKSLGVPYVIIFHGTDLCSAQVQSKKWRAVVRFVHHARRCVVNSQATARLFSQLLPEASAPALCAPGVDARHVSSTVVSLLQERIQADGRPIMLFLARLIARKGVLVALEALRMYVSRAHSAVLVIAGDGPERDAAQHFVAAHGLSQYVVFLGTVTDEEKWALYSMSHIFWFPAQEVDGEWEGFGITSREAQAMGCPSVVSDLHGLPETVRDGHTGRVVAPTPEAFADATEDILGNSTVWQQMRRGARADAVVHSVRAQQEQFLRDVIGGV